MAHPNYIDSFDYIFEGMTLKKYTHNLTFSTAKSCKTHFSGHSGQMLYVVVQYLLYLES